MQTRSLLLTTTTSTINGANAIVTNTTTTSVISRLRQVRQVRLENFVVTTLDHLRLNSMTHLPYLVAPHSLLTPPLPLSSPSSPCLHLLLTPPLPFSSTPSIPHLLSSQPVFRSLFSFLLCIYCFLYLSYSENGIGMYRCKNGKSAPLFFFTKRKSSPKV